MALLRASLLLVVFTLALLHGVPAALAADTWSNPEPGISSLHRTASDPLSIHAVVIDLCDPTLELRATRPAEAKQRTSAWGASVGARVAINGDFYNTANHHPIGLAMGALELWPGTSDSSSWALVAAGRHGVVEIRPASEALGSSPEAWMREIVGGHPNCLVDGAAQSSSESHYGQLHPRSGIGVSADGTKLVLAVIDGRWPGGSVGATTRRLGETLRDLGASDGLNFDGGGSSTLWMASPGVINRPSDGSERVVANHFGVVRVEVPQGEPSRCCRPVAVQGASGTFQDVPDTHWALDAIEALAAVGITSGCNLDPPYFCPGCRSSRAVTVAFLMRASGHDLTPPAAASFSDVPTSHPLFAEIEAAARVGVTAGCGAGRFCPDDPASRAVLAVFAARAMGLSTSTPSTPPFSDVPTTHFAAGAVQALLDVCAVGGCTEDSFCPDRTATRAEIGVVTARLTGLVGTACDEQDPEDPTDPTDPEDPTDPTDPEDPTDPTDPDDPSQPAEPLDPDQPTPGGPDSDRDHVDMGAGCSCSTPIAGDPPPPGALVLGLACLMFLRFRWGGPLGRPVRTSAPSRARSSRDRR